MVSQETKERWLDMLKDNDANVASYNDNTEPSYCALGVLMDMAERNAPKLTFRQRIRNRVSDFRYWLAS